MELSIENLARAAFPRTAAAQGAKIPRRLLSGIMDAASFPGRTLMAAADATGPTMTIGDIIANPSIPANSTDFLSSMGRTGAMPGRSRADAISESIIRDPISVLGLGAGSLAKAVGGKVAAATGSKVAPKLASYVADLLANSGTDAASQYATTGAIDPRQMALGAGLGLGMQGLGAGIKKLTPDELLSAKSIAEEIQKKLVSSNKRIPQIGEETRFIRFGKPVQFSTNYQTGTPEKGMSAYSIGDNGAANQTMRSEFTERPDAYIGTGTVVGYGSDGEPLFASVKNIRKALPTDVDVADYYGLGRKKWMDAMGYDAKGNRVSMPFDPTIPNITSLASGRTQTHSLQLPGFAKRLASRYMNDTTATSGRY